MSLLAIVAQAVVILTSGTLSGASFLDQNIMQGFENIPTTNVPIDISGIDFASGAFTTDDLKIGTPHELFLTNFESWATKHEITLVGTNKDAKYLAKRGFIPDKDGVDLKDVPGVLNAANALYKIPDSVIEVMKGKTIYFSTESGRSKSIHSAWGPDSLNRGFIIEQNVWDANVIHELGHIVDVHGIQGAYDDKQNIFSNSKDERDKIFQVLVKYEPNKPSSPLGHISRYSSQNDLENFADHFAYYVIYPDKFRDRIKNDPLLVDEYEFLRDQIFDGKEF